MTPDPNTTAAWQPIETAPRDGTPFWAYLFHSGIRKLRFCSASESAARDGSDAEDYEDAFEECMNREETWSPRFWLPLSAIPEGPVK